MIPGRVETQLRPVFSSTALCTVFHYAARDAQDGEEGKEEAEEGGRARARGRGRTRQPLPFHGRHMRLPSRDTALWESLMHAARRLTPRRGPAAGSAGESSGGSGLCGRVCYPRREQSGRGAGLPHRARRKGVIIGPANWSGVLCGWQQCPQPAAADPPAPPAPRARPPGGIQLHRSSPMAARLAPRPRIARAVLTLPLSVIDLLRRPSSLSRRTKSRWTRRRWTRSTRASSARRTRTLRITSPLSTTTSSASRHPPRSPR